MGVSTSKNNLAFCFMIGFGVQPDFSKARYWLEQSAEQGNRIAMMYLARLYQHGLGVEYDPDKVTEWIDRFVELERK